MFSLIIKELRLETILSNLYTVHAHFLLLCSRKTTHQTSVKLILFFLLIKLMGAEIRQISARFASVIRLYFFLSE